MQSVSCLLHNKQFIHTQPNVLPYYEQQTFNQQRQHHTVSTVLSTVGCCTVHFVPCSVSSIRSSNSKQCCCVSELAKFDVLMKNTVWYRVTSQLCHTVLLVATASADSLTRRESKLHTSVHCTGCLFLIENCCSTNGNFKATCHQSLATDRTKPQLKSHSNFILQRTFSAFQV